MSQLFGAKLRYIRQRGGLTQKQLAEQLSLASHAHVANLEASRYSPSLGIVTAVARLFNVSTDYLLRDELPVEYQETSHRVHWQEALVPVEFGDQLRLLRKELGISQLELAKQLGISRAFLSNVEGNRKGPNLDLVVKTAHVFHVTMDYLLFGLNPGTSNTTVSTNS
jgi:transcriptional regulator with XRE-family HTH domain